MAQVRDDGGERHVLPSGREIILPSGSRPVPRRSVRPWALLIASIAAVDLIALAVIGSNGDDKPSAGTRPPQSSPTNPPSSAAPTTAAPSSEPSSAPAPTLRGSPIRQPVVLSGRTPATCSVSDGSIVPPASGLCLWAGGADPTAATGTTTVVTTHDYHLKVGVRLELAGQDWDRLDARTRSGRRNRPGRVRR